MKLKGFIFDLDGTLINSLPIVRGSLHNTLLKFSGRFYSDQEVSALFGPSEEGIFKKLFPDQWRESLEFYLSEYERLHAQFTEPFPGIIEALTYLQKQHIKLALVSGKGPGSMAISLKYSGLKPFFEVVLTGSELQASKPEHINQVLKLWDCAPEEAAYVGDIAYDVQAAQETGVLAISALWSETAQSQKVLAMHPDQAFFKVEAFMDWLKEVL